MGDPKPSNTNQECEIDKSWAINIAKIVPTIGRCSRFNTGAWDGSLGKVAIMA
jgi:hypothetical protein